MSQSQLTLIHYPSCSSRHRLSSDFLRKEKSYERPRHRSSSESSTHKKSCKRPCPTSISSPFQSTTSKLPRADGLYKPPAKLRLLQASLTDLSTIEYQRLTWENLKKTITGRLNKVNTSNLSLIINELFQYNIVRGRGVLVRGIIEAQIASPFYTPVYAALVSFINSKIPQIGELVVKRLISSFHESYQRNNKANCSTTIRFIAHLINQNVLVIIFAIEMLVRLLKNPSDDSVALAIEFIKECGEKLYHVYPRILDSFFSKLRKLLDESLLDKRTLHMIEVLFAMRIDQFKANPSILSGLDLVDKVDQYTHMISLNDPCEPEPMLDVFQYDEQYQENEEKYKQRRRTILDEIDVNEDESSLSSSNSDDEEEKQDDRVENENQQSIIDQMNTNLLTLFRTMFSTIHLNNGAEKCARKLLKMNLPAGQEMEVCQIILDSCSQKRRYDPFFGLLGHRLCLLKTEYVGCFEKAFQHQYEIVHLLDNVKLKNVSKFFAYLLATNSISWSVFRCIRLTEEDTTLSSRIYIKYLFLQLVKSLGGLTKLITRLTDLTLKEYCQGLFPRDNPKDTEFSINFFHQLVLMD